MLSRITKSWVGISQLLSIVVVCLVSSSTANAAAVLVEHFKLDESGSTTTAANSANAGNPGTLNGTFIDGDSLWTPVNVNNGLRFDGTTDYVSLGTPRVFGGTDAWSISWWTNNTSTTTDNMIMGDSTVVPSFLWYYDGNYLRMYTDTATYYDFTSVTDFTGLNHFVLTVDDGVMDLYQDGTFTQTVSHASGTSGFTINALGDAYTSFELDGDLDDVGMWTGELPAEQAKAIYEFAAEPTLNYDLGQVQQLFDAFDASSSTVEIDGDIWRLISDGSLGGAVGVPDDVGNGFFEINLGGGNGFTSVPVPEPSSFLLLGLGALGLARHTRRRGHKA